MREVTYYYTDDCGLDILMKKVRDSDKGNPFGFYLEELMRRYGLRTGSVLVATFLALSLRR